MQGKEENNLLSLVLQVAMYKFGGKRDLGEVAHVTQTEPTGPANEKTGNSARELFISSSEPLPLLLRCCFVPLLPWQRRPDEFSLRAAEQ